MPNLCAKFLSHFQMQGADSVMTLTSTQATQLIQKSPQCPRSSCNKLVRVQLHSMVGCLCTSKHLNLWHRKAYIRTKQSRSCAPWTYPLKHMNVPNKQTLYTLQPEECIMDKSGVATLASKSIPTNCNVRLWQLSQA